MAFGSLGRVFGGLGALSVGVTGGGYHAGAVHLDGSTYLNIASLSAIDNQFFSYVMWVNLDTGLPPSTFPGLFQVDASGSYTTGAGTTTDADLANKFTEDIRMADVSGNNMVSVQDNDSLNAGTWYCIIASYDTLLGLAKVYINDVARADIVINTDSSGTLTFNGKQFTVGGDTFAGDNWIGSFADCRFLPGVSLLDGGGNIPTPTRRLFIDAGGKPVDPATATAALGAAGAALFSGNHTTFATNQGTGGAFTLTGAITDASTSPSD